MQIPDCTNPDRTRALDRGLRFLAEEEGEYSAERLSHQFEMRRAVPDVHDRLFFREPKTAAHWSSIRRTRCQFAAGQNWNNQMQARLVLVVETTHEQSISFSFEQLDISVESSRSTERSLVSQVGIKMWELDASPF